jgi:hypothetical protein
MMIGLRGNPLHRGRPGAGNTRPYLVPSREARNWSGAVAFGRCRKRRGGTPAGERARSGGSAQADIFVARRRARWHGVMKHCVCRRSASFISSFVLTPSSPDLFRRSRVLGHGIAVAIGMPGTSPGMTRSLFDKWIGKTRAQRIAPRERSPSSFPASAGQEKSRRIPFTMPPGGGGRHLI